MRWLITFRSRVAAAVAVVLVACLPTAADESASREAFDVAVELVTSGDNDMRSVALERLREGLAGEALSVELAERVLPSLPPAVQVQLLSTLAGRGDPAAVPGIVKQLEETSDGNVRLAAVRALAALGDGRNVPLLVNFLDADGPVRSVARDALVTIQGQAVSEALLAAVSDDSPVARRAALLGILADRRDPAALSTLLEAVGDHEGLVRIAAVESLGSLGGVAAVEGMVKGFLAATDDRERAAAEKAIVTVCTQSPDHERATAALLDRYESLEADERDAMLPTIARVGGPRVLTIVDRLLADPDPTRKEMGLAAMARWPDATVVDRILARVTTSTPEQRDLLVAALIRIAPLPGNGLDDAGKLALVQATMKLCARDGDRCRLLERAAAVRSVEMLRYVVTFLDDPVVAEAACRGVVELAHHRSLRDAHKEEFIAALDRVLATAHDAEVVERATRYKEGKTWQRKG